MNNFKKILYKQPNQLGRDVFGFNFEKNEKGLIYPLGYNKTQTEIDNNCLKSNSYYCAAKIIQEGWKMNY